MKNDVMVLVKVCGVADEVRCYSGVGGHAAIVNEPLEQV